MAARLRKELGIPVEEQSGAYGEFTVLVDGTPVSRAGALGFMGVLPSASEVIQQVRSRLSA